jgi:hypothetical protein
VEGCLLILGKGFLDQGSCDQSVALTSKGWLKHNCHSSLAPVKHAEKRPIAVKTVLSADDSTTPPATKKRILKIKLPERNKSRLGIQVAPCFYRARQCPDPEVRIIYD